MLENMTSFQLTEWMQFACLEPFGEWRDDFRAGQICSMIYNTHIDEKTKATSARDFMLCMSKKPKKVSPEELRKKIIEALGGVKE
jgi:hypothetical protein